MWTMEEFEKIASIPIYYHATQYHASKNEGSKYEIPAGAEFYELEIDYSGCYYEGDRPTYNISFYKKKNWVGGSNYWESFF